MQTHTREQRALTSAAHCGAILRMMDASPKAQANAKRVKAMRACHRAGPATKPPVKVDVTLSPESLTVVCEAPALLGQANALLAQLEAALSQCPDVGLDINPQVFVRVMRGQLGYVLGEMQRAYERHVYSETERLAEAGAVPPAMAVAQSMVGATPLLSRGHFAVVSENSKKMIAARDSLGEALYGLQGVSGVPLPLQGHISSSWSAIGEAVQAITDELIVLQSATAERHSAVSRVRV